MSDTSQQTSPWWVQWSVGKVSRVTAIFTTFVLVVLSLAMCVYIAGTRYDAALLLGVVCFIFFAWNCLGIRWMDQNGQWPKSKADAKSESKPSNKHADDTFGVKRPKYRR
jgi:hypothetical protein